MVYWMQRAQRAVDNPALDVSIQVGNELKKPVVVFFAPVPFYPNANWRHYAFLKQGIADIAEGLAKRHVGFVLRPYPDHSLIKFCEEARPALVIGDESPLRETEHWREEAAKRLRNGLRRCLPWMADEVFDLRSKHDFKDNVARALCCALPVFDLVIVDARLKNGHVIQARRSRWRC